MRTDCELLETGQIGEKMSAMWHSRSVLFKFKISVTLVVIVNSKSALSLFIKNPLAPDSQMQVITS